MKHISPLHLCIAIMISFLSCSKEEPLQPQQTEESSAYYEINGQEIDDLKRSWWIRGNYTKDTFDIFIRGFNEAGYVQRSISLSRLLLKEGKQKLLSPWGLNIPNDGRPSAWVQTILDDGLDFTGLDWFLLDTTYKENWVNILEYDEVDQFIRGTFQFRAIQDPLFNDGFSDLPDTILVKNGWFEADLR